jgi:hypothetical protein
VDKLRHGLVRWVCGYLAELTGVTIYKFQGRWHPILRWRAGGRTGESYWYRVTVALHHGKTTGNHRTAKASHCDEA